LKAFRDVGDHPDMLEETALPTPAAAAAPCSRPYEPGRTIASGGGVDLKQQVKSVIQFHV
jgi:hypothetical protein